MYDLHKKFIFTHPPKCGGTSIEQLTGFLKLRADNLGNRNISDFKHATLATHLNKIKSKGYCSDEFFKFSIIRNPWDRAVSTYFFCRKQSYEHEFITKRVPFDLLHPHIKDAISMPFKEFVLKWFELDFNSDKKTKPFMCFDDKLSVDYVIRLENIKNDLNKIKDKIQLDIPSDVPHLNNSALTFKRKPYQEYYDEETKNMVYKAFEWDINTFNYTF